MGQLAKVVEDSVLNSIVESLLSSIEGPKTSNDKRMLIQTISAMSRMEGSRMGAHLKRTVPLFLKSLDVDAVTAMDEDGTGSDGYDDDNAQSNEMCELRENIFQALSAFVLRCPRQVKSTLTISPLRR